MYYFPISLPDLAGHLLHRVHKIPYAAMRLLCGIFLASACLPVFAAEDSQPLVRHYENVLGTSMDLIVYGGVRADQERAADVAVTEIARLEQIFSTYRDDSEIMVLNQERSTSQASADLILVTEACESWMALSNGAFSCRMGQVIKLWDQAEANQVQPIVPNMLPTARTAQQGTIQIDSAARQIILEEAIDLDPSGLAKGYIIDQAMTVLKREVPDATAIKLDIGGDSSYWGAPPDENSWQVQVSDPEALADNGNYITTLGLNGLAVATSGHNTRTWTFGERHFSKILDTRRGWPVVDGLYSVVIAPDAVTADAMATLLSTQNPETAMNYVNAMVGVEALVIDWNGNQSISEGWQNHLGGELLRQANSVIDFSLEYNIPNIRDRSYERPYLSIWVSDADSRPIKNLLILGAEDRWARTNSVWWSRVGRRRVVPASNVTRPTREPGKYNLAWDGRDDDGNIILQGGYHLMVEASREHGGHTYMSIPFSLEEGARVYEMKGEEELGDMLLRVTLTPPD
jgi:FAD:protein FMN transferase